MSLSVFFEFDSTHCLEGNSKCRLDGFYFDTYDSFKPEYFYVSRPYSYDVNNYFPNKNMLPDFLSDMKGYEFTVATLHYDPFIRIHKDSDGNVLYYTGIEIDLINYLGRRSNFTYRLINPPDGAWGVPDPETGIWSGLIGHALYGKSNWSMSGIAVNPWVGTANSV